ncbi:hypothetical protein KKG24_04180 [Patescibacteria group bacterium]|nr:hypothetical protein [Patescibacteria group bacterium]
MSIENTKNPEQNKEAVFQNWLTEFQGRFWLNKEATPEGIYDALRAYKHWKVNGKRDEASVKMEEATNNFEKLTGYNIQDFLEYQKKQSEKLKIDKK